MRVVHLSTSDRQGGAALGMWRLHEGLRQLGVDSRVVTRQRSVPDDRVSTVVFEMEDEADRFQLERLHQRLAEGATCVSFMLLRANILEHPWVRDADIVHLHWVATFLDADVVQRLERAGKQVFWTFHDLRPFTGFCHFTAGCRGFETTCSKCPQADEDLHEMIETGRLRLKDSYASQRLQVIVPSEWTRQKALVSGLFEASRVHRVCYGIDEAFCIESESMSTTKLERVQLLFGCQTLKERRKGFAELKEALEIAMQQESFAGAVAAGRLELVTFGLAEPGFLDGVKVPVRSLGTIQGVDALARVFREASVLVCPTLEDTGPLVVLEALGCGCPVVGFKVGALEDHVVDGANGLLVEPGDVVGLADILTRVLLEEGLLETLTAGAVQRADTIPKLMDSAKLVQQLYLDQLADHAEVMEPVRLTTIGVDPAGEAVLREFLNHLPGAVEQDAKIQHLQRRLEVEIGKKEALKLKLEEMKREKIRKDLNSRKEAKSGWTKWFR